MGARVLSFFRPQRRHEDWSQQELAEFYRVEAALIQAGLSVETERGLSDEGEPWFAFCRADDGEVVVHFARLDGQYIVAGPAYDGVARGADFSGLVRDLIGRHPLVQARGRDRGNVLFHPAALLVAVVATALFKTSEARAYEEDDDRQRSGTASTGGVLTSFVQLDARQILTTVAAISLVLAADRPAPVSPEDEAAGLARDPSALQAIALSSVRPDPVAADGDEDGPAPGGPQGPADALIRMASTQVDSATVSLIAVLTDLPATQARMEMIGGHDTGPVPSDGPVHQRSPVAEPAARDTDERVSASVLQASPNQSVKASEQVSSAAVGHDEPKLKVELKAAAGLPDVQAVKAIAGDGVKTTVEHLDALPENIAAAITQSLLGASAAKAAEVGGQKNASPGDRTGSGGQSLKTGSVDDGLGGSAGSDKVAQAKDDVSSKRAAAPGQGDPIDVDKILSAALIEDASPSGPRNQAGTGAAERALTADAPMPRAESAAAVVAAPVEPASAQSTGQGTGSKVADPAAIERALKAFFALTEDARIVMTDFDVVVYDFDAVIRDVDADHGAGDHLSTVTWAYADGSTISLVGPPAHLPIDLI